MTFELTIEPLGQTVDVEEGQTLLDASLRAGVYLPHACGHGLCGTCKVQVLDGEIDHGPISSFALMDFEREEGLCLACCATAESDITIEADIDDEPDARNLPVRSATAIVTRIENLTPTIKGVWAKVDAPEGLPFQAGQYVNVQLPGGQGHRPFSFAQSPSNPHEIELDVRFVPGGVATTWIHEQLAVGDQLQLAGPYGRFHVRASANQPLLFLAGGSGLSSPRSMILDLVEQGCTLPITLVYGARNRDELYYVDEFTRLATEVPTFTYVPTLSHEPDDSDWTGARGFVHDAAKAHFQGDFRGLKAYLCGPPAMIDACISTLMQGRLFERDIYQELFISAADTARARSPLFKRI
ncbi:MAG: phenol 2-monooxygenase domain-containing protein [Actinomycetota bacterium]|nr:phenol 2-monooxygenase domain-containing protein [Actinomycetota bacterium]